MSFVVTDLHIQESNARAASALSEDYDHLSHQLARRDIDIERLVQRAIAFRVAVPSWGVGTGGTRFARFPLEGEPRNIFEKLEDCEVVFKVTRVTPGISLHIPWDKPENAAELRAFAASRGLFVDSMNSNTFQDQPGQKHSYRYGSLTHTDAAVRRIARAAGGAPALKLEFEIAAPKAEGALTACGVLAINPPWKLREECAAMLPPLSRVLAGENRGAVQIEAVE